VENVRRIRIALWVLAAIAVAGFAALMFSASRQSAPDAEPISMVSFGGPFTLTAADGQPFSSSKLVGKPYAIFFGFTHCPDVCPTTLARLVRLRQQLGNARHPLEIVFVTVDPERDGPAEVGRYTDLFGSPIVALTGSPAQISHVKNQFGIYSEKRPDGQGGYSVDHTATVLLFDSNGNFTATIAPEESDGTALDKLKRITA
jgi:protein SCO1/2